MSNRLYMRVLRENPYTALRTFELSREAYAVVSKYLSDYHDAIPSEVARGRGYNKSGHFTFQCGVGYAVVDADLLGGNGDGERERHFNEVTGYYLYAPNNYREVPAEVRRNW